MFYQSLGKSLRICLDVDKYVMDSLLCNIRFHVIYSLFRCILLSFNRICFSSIMVLNLLVAILLTLDKGGVLF